MIIWIIGLSGAGKTTLAHEVVVQARNRGGNPVLLDGDLIREIFGNDLGYSIEERLKNAERICRLCKLLDSQGINVVCSILSIFPSTRIWNRENYKSYFEVFIDAPMDDLILRDSKGIYSKYNNNQIVGVAGLDIQFIPPDNANLTIKNIHTKEDLLSHASKITDLLF